MIVKTKVIGAGLLACAVLAAQAPLQDENANRLEAGQTPIYRVTVTERTAKAINYRSRSGATKIDFRGTELLAESRGEAKVESKQGYIEIEVEFDDLKPANQFGAEYLTYVMWAITPEGRTSNLGEVLLNGTKSKLNVTTDLQVFGLVVTAEPYYSVTMPSDLIVMENVVRADTKGKIEEIDAKYELLERGQYTRLANPLALNLDRKIPLELYEARNAVQIARSMGADRFATETFEKAEQSLAQAEAYQARNAGKKPVIMTARTAVQTAEDSRAIAAKRQEEAALATERQESAQRQARAESQRVAARLETDRVSREAEDARVRAQAEAARLTREKEAQAVSAQAEADRVKRQTDLRTATAEAEANRARREIEGRAATAKADADRQLTASNERLNLLRAEADGLQRENEAQKAANLAQAAASADQEAQLQADKAELRTELMKQFNAVLQTRDTARGLIVNMSDVLFNSGQYALQPGAREKLAKVAGIISGHPGLMLSIEGHTDSVGSDEANQRLSERRGSAVRDYLTQQGIASSSVTSKGLGETQPVATNDTVGGRQQNRRVELVISGDLIGAEIGAQVVVR